LPPPTPTAVALSSCLRGRKCRTPPSCILNLFFAFLFRAMVHRQSVRRGVFFLRLIAADAFSLLVSWRTSASSLGARGAFLPPIRWMGASLGPFPPRFRKTFSWHGGTVAVLFFFFPRQVRGSAVFTIQNGISLTSNSKGSIWLPFLSPPRISKSVNTSVGPPICFSVH